MLQILLLGIQIEIFSFWYCRPTPLVVTHVKATANFPHEAEWARKKQTQNFLFISHRGIKAETSGVLSECDKH